MEKVEGISKDQSSRVRGLDGLRAISALLVILFHVGIVPAGWVGVEVFFVLSGFLITRILIQSSREDGGILTYLGRFFWRRSLRIFPLYYALILVEAVWCMMPGRHGGFKSALLARATYTYNWFRALHHGSDPSRLTTHFWSLACEEQFYFVWPFLVYFLFRRGWFAYAATGLVIAGALSRVVALLVLPPEHVAWIVYHGGIFYIGPLALGSVLATGILPRVKQAWVWAVAFALATVSIGGAMNGFRNNLGFGCTMPDHYQWLWAYVAIDMVAAALVLACIQNEPVIHLLEWRPLKRLGRVSYGFYIVHPFVIFIVWRFGTRLRLMHGMLVLLAILLTWVVAELSFRYFETPFLALKDRYSSEGRRRCATPPVLFEHPIREQA